MTRNCHWRLQRADFRRSDQPGDGIEADAEPSHRHAIRLTKVSMEDEDGDPLVDLLHGTPVVEIEWSVDDALPFPLRISAKVGDGTGENPIQNLSVARGNVVLADHGRTISELITLSMDEAGNLSRPVFKMAPVAQQGHARDKYGRLVRDDQNEPVVFDLRGWLPLPCVGRCATHCRVFKLSRTATFRVPASAPRPARQQPV